MSCAWKLGGGCVRYDPKAIIEGERCAGDMLQPFRVRLFGFPLGHSVSPAMHSAAAESLGIAMEYLAQEIGSEQLPGAVQSLRGAEYLGANVTLPHKPAVMALVDHVSPLARRIGAVNTVFKAEGRLVGDNTDAPAVVRCLRESLAFAPEEERVLLLGAGGAARGAAVGLLDAGVRQLAIWNRTAWRSLALVQSLATPAPATTTDIGVVADLDAALQRRNPACQRNQCRTGRQQRSGFAVRLAEDRARVRPRLRPQRHAARASSARPRPAGGGWSAYARVPGRVVVCSVDGSLRAGGRHARGRRSRARTATGSRSARGGWCRDMSRSLVLVGLSGSGKSTVGRLLASRLSLPFVDTDRQVELRAGMSIAEMFERLGEEEFRRQESEVLIESCAGQAVVATGGGAVLRADNRDILRAGNLVVWIDVPVPLLVKRLNGHTQGEERPLLRSDNLYTRLERLSHGATGVVSHCLACTVPGAGGRSPGIPKNSLGPRRNLQGVDRIGKDAR